MKAMWRNAILGVITGDALGCPVQFKTREEIAQDPVTGMRGNGTFNLPAGSWTDDSSMTIALLVSIQKMHGIDLDDVMGQFIRWLEIGVYTPYGHAFDVGRTTLKAIRKYQREKKPLKCGLWDETSQSNGSLMRIMPACLYCIEQKMTDQDALRLIHQVGSHTHAHICCNIACGLTYFMSKAILTGEGTLTARLQSGLDCGFAWYEKALSDHEFLHAYDRLRDLAQFAQVPVEKIQSSGYVVSTLEAALWSLVTTDTFPDALLKAVNLGKDTDTVAAVAGGLGGLFYGAEAIPSQWLSTLARKDWIDSLFD